MRKLVRYTGYIMLGIVGLIVVAALQTPTTSPAQDDSQKQSDSQKPPIPSPNPQPEAESVEQPKPEKPKDEMRVSGDVPSASCSIMDDSGSRSVDMPVPSSEPIEMGFGSYVGVNCQKPGEAGTLTVEIVSDGEVVAEQTTSAAYGLAETHYPQ